MNIPYHIIIADDTDSMRGILARIIARTYPSVRISAVANGQEALSIFEREGADLIVTNNRMQQMDGLSLIRTLRSRNETTPIVMVSSDASLEQLALAAGANYFVAKPFTMQELTRVLITILPV